jgi:hypothetical protein
MQFRAWALILASLFFVSTALSSDPLFGTKIDYEVGDFPWSVATADFDGDGDVDLATANYHSGDVTILMNNGEGEFADAVDLNLGHRPRVICAADLDNDGDIDLAVVNHFEIDYYRWAVMILQNNGDGTFVYTFDHSVNIDPVSIAAVDLNNDGYLDLAVPNRESDNMTILMNNGNATFSFNHNYSVYPYANSVFGADLDSDGDYDLAVAAYAKICIFMNNGDGTFASYVDYDVGASLISIYGADFDDDGDVDLATANSGSHNISVLMNNGSGIFDAAVNYEAGYQPNGIYSADLDGDGDFDLASVNSNSQDVSIFLNTGDGIFSTLANFGVGQYPGSITGADFDGDGDIDLVTSNGYSDSVSILINRTINEYRSILSPDPVYMLYANSNEPLQAQVVTNQFAEEFTAGDINQSSLIINSSITPTSSNILPSHPDFSGEVLEMIFPLRDFILSYGWLYDATIQPYTISGEFTDGIPFIYESEFTLVGHRSGDANGDSQVNVGDVVFLINYVFTEGPAPYMDCIGDVNCDERINIADAVGLVNYIFRDGSPPQVGCGP